MDYKELADELLLICRKNNRPFAPPHDISKGEIGLLTYLAFDNNYMLAGDLSQTLGLTSGRIASALKSLEGKGFITRVNDPNDKRKVIVSITKEGKTFAENGKQKAILETAGLLEYLGEKDAQELVRLVKKIINMPQ